MNKILLTALCATGAINAHYHPYDQSFSTQKMLEEKAGIGFEMVIGKSDEAYNSNKEKTALADIFGKHNLHFLGVNQARNTLDVIPAYRAVNNDNWPWLEALAMDTITNIIQPQVDTKTYGQFALTGKFSYKKGCLSFTSPSYEGLQLTFSLPFSVYSFSKVIFSDLTPDTGNGGFNLQKGEWIDFRRSFDAILKEYHLSISKYDEKGFGDIQVGVHYKTLLDDSLKGAIHGTIIMPSGKQKNENELFSLAHGYDGHWGLQTGATLEAQIQEYITLQGSVENIIFASDDKVMRLKTYEGQEGFLFLAQGNTRRKKGTITNLSTAAFLSCPEKPFVLSIGYSYTRAQKTELTPLDGVHFDRLIANSDKRFDSWNRHSITISGALYSSKSSSNAQLEFACTIPVAGKNIFISKGFGMTAATTFSYEI